MHAWLAGVAGDVPPANAAIESVFRVPIGHYNQSNEIIAGRIMILIDAEPTSFSYMVKFVES
jgi:hypothetical protein